MKKFFALLLALAMVLTMVACGNKDGGKDDDKVYTIKYAHTCADNHAYQVLGTEFKEAVEAASNGRLKVELYPSSQLGGETDLMEGLQAGTVEMATISDGVAANFVEGLNIFALPFLFSGVDHYQKVVFGEIGEEFIAKVDGQNGLKVAGLWGSTFRYPFSNTGPLTTVEDFKGVKIRLMEVPLHMDTYAAMGANPMSMAMADVYGALQNNTMNAAENAISSIYSQKFYEVAKDITLAPVIGNGCITLFSQSFWDSLPEDLQKICEDAMDDAIKAADDYYVAAEDSARTAMEAEGAVFHEVDDIEPFKAAVAGVRDAATKDIADWAVALLPKIDALA